MKVFIFKIPFHLCTSENRVRHCEENAEAQVKTWTVQKFEATVPQQPEVFQSKLAGPAKAN
jgi:hypothetical protein